MADVIEKDLTKVTSSDLTPITKPNSGTDKRYMRMVDKDGNSVDVEVSAFLRAAIRDELASILESGGTGGGSVLSVIGGVLKTRTDADLASVLGANISNGSTERTAPNGTSCNNLPDYGVYAMGNLADNPFGENMNGRILYGYYRVASARYQIAHRVDKIYVRWMWGSGNVWGSWKEINLNNV